jgi:hypothetical protein
MPSCRRPPCGRPCRSEPCSRNPGFGIALKRFFASKARSYKIQVARMAASYMKILLSRPPFMVQITRFSTQANMSQARYGNIR